MYVGVYMMRDISGKVYDEQDKKTFDALTTLISLEVDAWAYVQLHQLVANRIVDIVTEIYHAER